MWSIFQTFKHHCPNTSALKKWKYYPGQKKKKEPSLRFAARSTLFHRVISCSISPGQKSPTVADDLALRWSLVIKHITWWNSALLAANLRDGSFFFFFLSRVQCIQNFFPKFCLILKEWFLTRFPPNFQERFLMSSASPEFVFWGPKIKQFCFKQVLSRSGKRTQKSEFRP